MNENSAMSSKITVLEYSYDLRPFDLVDQNKYMCTNSVDSDKMAHNKPSHQDLLCLLFSSRLLTDFFICNNRRV